MPAVYLYGAPAASHRRLVWLGESPTAGYWDDHWAASTLCDAVRDARRHPILLEVFLHYSPPRGRVLEAGCGQGQWVVVLRERGRQVVGVDFATETLRSTSLSRLFAPPPLASGDVRALPFADGTFDTYMLRHGACCAPAATSSSPYHTSARFARCVLVSVAMRRLATALYRLSSSTSSASAWPSSHTCWRMRASRSSSASRSRHAGASARTCRSPRASTAPSPAAARGHSATVPAHAAPPQRRPARPIRQGTRRWRQARATAEPRRCTRWQSAWSTRSQCAGWPGTWCSLSAAGGPSVDLHPSGERRAVRRGIPHAPPVRRSQRSILRHRATTRLRTPRRRRGAARRNLTYSTTPVRPANALPTTPAY
ncbi:MAG: class I SAM-dependent methyltransferase [Chloroflexi bacterium]|nr:class I SAM-dependent methyltransferase [Chloroflexota bacterium]